MGRTCGRIWVKRPGILHTPCAVPPHPGSNIVILRGAQGSSCACTFSLQVPKPAQSQQHAFRMFREGRLPVCIQGLFCANEALSDTLTECGPDFLADCDLVVRHHRAEVQGTTEPQLPACSRRLPSLLTVCCHVCCGGADSQPKPAAGRCCRACATGESICSMVALRHRPASCADMPLQNTWEYLVAGPCCRAFTTAGASAAGVLAGLWFQASSQSSGGQNCRLRSLSCSCLSSTGA